MRLPSTVFFALTGLLGSATLQYRGVVGAGPDQVHPPGTSTSAASGFDDMFPLIDLTEFPDPIPDHHVGMADYSIPFPHADVSFINPTAHGEISQSNQNAEQIQQLQPSSSYPPRDVGQSLTMVPPFGETILPEKEFWHIERMLKVRLNQAHVDFTSLRLVPPLQDTRHVHLDMLRSQLQLQVNSKQAVYLTPTIDHRARIIAVPIHRDTLKMALVEREDTGRVGWAIVGVRPGRLPEMTWFAYALLDVPNRRIFVNSLINSRKVKALKDFLIPRV